MVEQYAVHCIVEGARHYFRVLGQAQGMSYHAGEVEWIAPLAEGAGPRIIFHASLPEDGAAERIEAILPGIRAGGIPSGWWITPAPTPGNLRDVLAAKGLAREKREADEAGSVEFVSTLAAHRKQGAGTAVSAAALRGLGERGVQTATLRGSPMAVGLYERLGFRPYFSVEIMSYQGEPAG